MEWADVVLLVINIAASAIPLTISIWADAFYEDQPEIPIGSQVRMNIVYSKSSLCKMNEINPFDTYAYCNPHLSEFYFL